MSGAYAIKTDDLSGRANTVEYILAESLECQTISYRTRSRKGFVIP